ncbi:TolC family protein [Anditalea andensis]|uniref:Transporter n=1 Tax=Anditalea andensis TaxID=1048983 RepID=A0A074KSP1_9BACT|nr:TolC family protein [Anditalea andensis]KEO72986.1 hypothetical protein EL17_15340 [Anditalea andensis]
MYKSFIVFLSLIIWGIGMPMARAQTVEYTLEEILKFSYNNQPLLKQTLLEKDLTDARVRSDLSGWLPQIGLDGDYFRYFEQPVAIFPDFNNPTSGQFQEVRTGVPYNSNLNFFLDQPIFNNQLILAKDQANLRRRETDQQLKIFLIDFKIEVSKAFYEVLLSQEQIRITEEDLQRQERQLRDARSLYEAGITDNIDYKRATITLQNTRSSLYQSRETFEVRMALLRELSGLGIDEPITLAYDLEGMISGAMVDTLEGVDISQRPEIHQIQLQQSLQDMNVSFFKRTYIPQLSAFLNYNIIYQSPFGDQLFDRAYPNSLAGLRLSFPIFQGGKRNHDIRVANLELRQLELAQDNLSLQLQREHQEALSNYKSNLYQMYILEGNNQLAEEIYNTVSLQYEAGIKNFLEVIQAETDLRTSRINYYNAVFRLMGSKLDLLKARGQLEVDIY